MSQVQMDHRRAHLRFEVLGRMTGSLLSTETLRVLNLGVSGALVEAALPLPPNAEYRMQLVLDSHVSEATVKIRRVNEVRPDAGPLRYRIGLEFLAITQEAEEVINRIVVANQAQV
jgi:hypothetical protein